MLGKYKERVARLPAGARDALAEEFELDLMSDDGRGWLVAKSPAASLAEALERSGLGSADVVLALLRRNFRSEAAMVAGTKIEVGTPALTGLPPAPRPARRAALPWEDKRLVRKREENPRMPGSSAWERYEKAQPGMTRGQLLAKGVTRRDMREWERRRWATFEK